MVMRFNDRCSSAMRPVAIITVTTSCYHLWFSGHNYTCCYLHFREVTSSRTRLASRASYTFPSPPPSPLTISFLVYCMRRDCGADWFSAHVRVRNTASGNRATDAARQQPASDISALLQCCPLCSRPFQPYNYCPICNTGKSYIADFVGISAVMFYRR